MSDDDPQRGTGGLSESSDSEVKEKVAQLSGLRMKQKRLRKHVDAARARAPKREKQPAADPATKPSAQPGTDSKPSVAPETLSKSRGKPRIAESIPERAEPSRGAAPRKAGTPKPPRSTRPSVAFVAGVAGGCIPAIGLILMAVLTAETPEGIPEDAVERQHDWIHCPKPATNQRWRCDVYATSGKLASTGEFVLSADAKSTSTDWRTLAGSGALVPDGWHDAELAREKTLHVMGVKVSSVSTRGQR